MSTSSTLFPAGLPGAAALILRISASSMLALAAARYYALSELAALGLIVLAAFLCFGFFTRWVALICAILVAVVAITTAGTTGTMLGLLALDALALALLGGGAYSVDARLFGRTVITGRE